MKPVNKLLSFVISLFVVLPIFLVFPGNKVSAQGTCSCAPGGTSCTPASNNCVGGYVLRCTGMSGGYCTSSGCDCVTPTPDPRGCTCLLNSDCSTTLNYCQSPFYEPVCSGPNNTCTSVSGCHCGNAPTPTPDTQCECAPGGTSCTIIDHCGAGLVERCTGMSGNYCTSSGCTCVYPPTPTPDTQCECAPGGTSCTIVDYCGVGYTERCTGMSGGYCTTSGCTCVSPTPPLPTQFQDCQDLCTDPQFPVGNCLDTQGADPPGCVNPPGNNNYDCVVNSLDCLCCTELLEGVTPRATLNPLCGPNSINTAVGCLPVGDKNTFLVFLLRWAIGISGGASFVLIIYSGFMIMTASGDKRKLQSGKELLTAALSGLILIVFSVFILDLIGIRILKIPGL